MLESPKSAILTLRFVSSKRFSGLRSLRTKNLNVFCCEEHLYGIMDGRALDSRWDVWDGLDSRWDGWDSIGY